MRTAIVQNFRHYCEVAFCGSNVAVLRYRPDLLPRILQSPFGTELEELKKNAELSGTEEGLRRSHDSY